MFLLLLVVLALFSFNAITMISITGSEKSGQTDQNVETPGDGR